MFIFLYIYNKQITANKVLCTDFYSLVAKLFRFPKLQLVNKNPYKALPMK